MVKSRLLIVDDEPGSRLGVRSYLEGHGYDVDEAESVGTAMRILHAQVPDVALVDYSLPDGTALDLMAQLRQQNIDVPVVVLTGHGSIELAVMAVKEGAEQFLTKPVELGSLAHVLDRVIEHQLNSRRILAVQSSRQTTSEDGFISGRSPAVRALAHDAKTAAACDAPILIEGETGTGKGVLAQWIHSASARRAAKPSSISTARGLPRELLESELFGHEKGAFTGATARSRACSRSRIAGRCSSTRSATSTPQVQPKLLKVARGEAVPPARRRRRPAGRRPPHRRDAPRPASSSCAKGEFREDLYYRINTIAARGAAAARAQARTSRCSPQQLLEPTVARRSAGRAAPRRRRGAQRSRRYAWPGNIRELRNVLERAMLAASSPVLRSVDLRLSASPRRSLPAMAAATIPVTAETLKEVEWLHIQRVLDEEKGSVGRASKRLGIPRSSLYQKLKLRDAGGNSAA